MRTTFALMTVLIVLSCSNSTDPSSERMLSYRAYDAEETPVAEGWFTMSEEDSANVSGQWHITAIGNPEDIGPQIGYGSLVGSISGDTLSINLNPQYADNNVILWGLGDGVGYDGQWSWVTYAGVTNQGSFEAAPR